jgi:hypothetical protein
MGRGRNHHLPPIFHSQENSQTDLSLSSSTKKRSIRHIKAVSSVTTDVPSTVLEADRPDVAPTTEQLLSKHSPIPVAVDPEKTSRSSSKSSKKS